MTIEDVWDHDWERRPHRGWLKVLALRIGHARACWRLRNLRFRNPSIWALLNAALGVVLPSLAFWVKSLDNRRCDDSGLDALLEEESEP